MAITCNLTALVVLATMLAFILGIVFGTLITWQMLVKGYSLGVRQGLSDDEQKEFDKMQKKW